MSPRRSRRGGPPPPKRSRTHSPRSWQSRGAGNRETTSPCSCSPPLEAKKPPCHKVPRVTEGDPGYRGGMSSTRVLILGGDGYLGWPTALHLSARGYEVALVDDFSRRRWHLEQSTDSLTPIRSLAVRVAAWEEVSGRRLRAHVGDITDAEFLDGVVARFRPDAIVHYGEQPSAPWSMASRRQAVETQRNNVVGTLNLLFSIRAQLPDLQPVKVGTM